MKDDLKNRFLTKLTQNEISTILQKQDNEIIYQKAVELYKKEMYIDAISEFSKIKEYRNSKKFIELCKEKKKEEQKEKTYQKAVNASNSGRYQEALAWFNTIIDYKNSKVLIKLCQNRLVEKEKERKEKEEQKEKTYQKAVDAMNSGMYQEAFAWFEEIAEYKNSKAFIELCKKRLEEKEKKRKELEEQKEKTYQKAIDTMNSGRYQEALEQFKEIKDYGLSKHFVTICNKKIEEEKKEVQYKKALELEEKEFWASAQKIYEELGDYKDSEIRKGSCIEKNKEENKKFRNGIIRYIMILVLGILGVLIWFINLDIISIIDVNSFGVKDDFKLGIYGTMLIFVGGIFGGVGCVAVEDWTGLYIPVSVSMSICTVLLVAVCIYLKITLLTMLGIVGAIILLFLVYIWIW